LKNLQESGQALPNFPLSATFGASLNLDQRDITSDNVIATLPGSDPVLKNQYLVLSAHLDGYGLGEPRHGDPIYNGAFDDAAYVALLMDLAQSLHESHTRLKRSLLLCIVTGEEKGLLGSRYFAAHPTVNKSQLVADLNLDQLRPIFPLQLLTVLALKQSTLGQTVAEVAQQAGIQIQEDPEPERNLLRRSDHYSFMQIGVPSVNFVFGYRKGSPEEKIYRSWYAERYHSPADDLEQPWVPEAAGKFNAFYAALVTAVADAPERPHWLPGSEFAATK
jgi:Zn-dependent M28 family amino/carboxypeptidase